MGTTRLLLVALLLGAVHGQWFGAEHVISTGNPSTTSVSAAKGSQDGLNDIVAGRFLYENRLEVTGDGWQTRSVDARNLTAVFFRDFNKDGLADVVALEQEHGVLVGYTNKARSSGVALDPVSWLSDAPGDATASLAVGDLTNDGFPDIVFASPLTGRVAWLRNVADIGLDLAFRTQQRLSLILPGLVCIGLGDIDGDGDLDILAHTGSLTGVGGGTLHAYLNLMSDGLEAPFSEGIVLSDDVTTTSIHVGDINGDGLDDIVMDDSWLPNPGFPATPFPTRPTSFPTAVTGWKLLADLDADGTIDIITPTRLSGLARIVGPDFDTIEPISARSQVAAAAAADIDLDGDLDLVLLDGSTLLWLESTLNPLPCPLHSAPDANEVCQECHLTCLGCSSPGDSDACTSCEYGRTLSSSGRCVAFGAWELRITSTAAVAMSIVLAFLALLHIIRSPRAALVSPANTALLFLRPLAAGTAIADFCAMLYVFTAAPDSAGAAQFSLCLLLLLLLLQLAAALGLRHYVGRRAPNASRLHTAVTIMSSALALDLLELLASRASPNPAFNAPWTPRHVTVVRRVSLLVTLSLRVPLLVVWCTLAGRHEAVIAVAIASDCLLLAVMFFRRSERAMDGLSFARFALSLGKVGYLPLISMGQTSYAHPPTDMFSRDDYEKTAAKAAQRMHALRVKPGSPVPPVEIVCPITGEVMVNPVRAADGVAYERDALLARWARGEQVSAVDGTPLGRVGFRRDERLEGMAEKWREECGDSPLSDIEDR